MKSSIRDFNKLEGKEKIVFCASYAGKRNQTLTSLRRSVVSRADGYRGYGTMWKELSDLPANIVVHIEHNKDNFTDRIWHVDPKTPSKFIQYYYSGRESLPEQLRLIKSAEFNVGMWSIFYTEMSSDDQAKWGSNEKYFTDALKNWENALKGTKQNPIAIQTNVFTDSGNTENGSLFFTSLDGEKREIYGKEMVYKFSISEADSISISISNAQGDSKTDLALYILDERFSKESVLFKSVGDFKDGETKIASARLDKGTYYILVKTLVTSKIGREGQFNLTFSGKKSNRIDGCRDSFCPDVLNKIDII